MVIEREELDRREVDLSDVTTGRRLSPVHPENAGYCMTSF